MKYCVLGPVEMFVRDKPVTIQGTMQRTFLGVLLLSAGRTVSTGKIAEALWGDNPPARAVAQIHTYASRIRHAIEKAGGDRGLLQSDHPGHRIVVGKGELDLEVYQTDAAEGRAALRDQRFEEAAESFSRALSRWQMPTPLENVSDRIRQLYGAQLRQHYFGIVEDWAIAKLALGQHVEVITRLTASVDDNPLQEHLWALLMLALYRGGRRSEALGAFARYRVMLGDELGLDPKPEVVRLQQMILAGAPQLDDVSWKLS
jgi:DNA-binding SARP family transcriptional activator